MKPNQNKTYITTKLTAVQINERYGNLSEQPHLIADSDDGGIFVRVFSSVGGAGIGAVAAQDILIGYLTQMQFDAIVS